MPEADFTQLAAQLWKNEGEPAGMSATAFLNFLRTDEGGNLAIRTQTYYRMIGELQSLTDTLPAQWNEPLDAIPETVFPLTRPGAEPSYWHHVNVFEWLPGAGPGGYIMVPHNYTVKSSDLMTRREAVAIAEADMQGHQPMYGIEGSFISGGVVTAIWDVGNE